MTTAPESLIEYPSQFPIKVMGIKSDGLVHAISLIARQFDPGFDASTIELRESKAGKYLGVTVTVVGHLAATIGLDHGDPPRVEDVL